MGVRWLVSGVSAALFFVSVGDGKPGVSERTGSCGQQVISEVRGSTSPATKLAVRYSAMPPLHLNGCEGALIQDTVVYNLNRTQQIAWLSMISEQDYREHQSELQA